MENEGMDLSGAVDMLKEMLSGDEGKQQLQNIMNMFSGAVPEGGEPGSATGGIDADNIEMLMRLQQAVSIANSRKNSSQSRLLTALKPFLKPSRQEKVDNAVRMLSLSGVIEAMREVKGD